MDRVALILTVLGGVNWGLVGLFRFDLVAFICGGSGTWIARVVYVIIAIAAIWCASLLFRENEVIEERRRESFT